VIVKQSEVKYTANVSEPRPLALLCPVTPPALDENGEFSDDCFSDDCFDFEIVNFDDAKKLGEEDNTDIKSNVSLEKNPWQWCKNNRK